MLCGWLLNSKPANRWLPRTISCRMSHVCWRPRSIQRLGRHRYCSPLKKRIRVNLRELSNPLACVENVFRENSRLVWPVAPSPFDLGIPRRGRLRQEAMEVAPVTILHESQSPFAFRTSITQSQRTPARSFHLEAAVGVFTRRPCPGGVS